MINLVPPVLRQNFGVDDYTVDMQVDNVRNVLYTADSSSYLSVFYLGTDGYASSYTCHSFSLLSTLIKEKVLVWCRYGDREEEEGNNEGNSEQMNMDEVRNKTVEEKKGDLGLGVWGIREGAATPRQPDTGEEHQE